MADTLPQIVKWRRVRAWFRHHGVEDAQLRQLARAIDSLPDSLHEVFRLARFEDLTVKQIAQRLDVSEEQAGRDLAQAMSLVTLELARQERAADWWRRFCAVRPKR